MKIEAQDQFEHDCSDWIKPKHLTQKQTQKHQNNQGFMKNNTELNEHKNKHEIRHLSLEDHGSTYQMMEKCLHEL